MNLINGRVSQNLGHLASIPPASQGVGTATSGWVSMAVAGRMLAEIDVGVFGAVATVDAKLQQATDGAGTGAKDIPNKAITQLVAAGGNNRSAWIDLLEDELDVTNGFAYVQLSITVGTAATLIAGRIKGVQEYDDAASADIAALAQVVP